MLAPFFSLSSLLYLMHHVVSVLLKIAQPAAVYCNPLSSNGNPNENAGFPERTLGCISIFLFSCFLLSNCSTSLPKGTECIVLLCSGPCLRPYALKPHWASKLVGFKADSAVAMATKHLFVAPLSDAETNEKTRVGYYTFTKRLALQADQLTVSA